MSSDAGNDESGDVPGAGVDLPPVDPKPVAEEIVQGELVEEQALLRLEARLIRVLRKEVQDPYGGLPADDVLERLHNRFPAQEFPERMLRRIENEQSARLEHVRSQDRTDQYIAETQRQDTSEERQLQRETGKRAERVVWGLVAVGLLLVFTGFPEIGAIVLGTTLVGVATAFITQQVRKN